MVTHNQNPESTQHDPNNRAQLLGSGAGPDPNQPYCPTPIPSDGQHDPLAQQKSAFAKVADQFNDGGLERLARLQSHMRHIPYGEYQRRKGEMLARLASFVSDEVWNYALNEAFKEEASRG